MSSKLLLHQRTEVDIHTLIESPAQAVIIEGKAGSGKSSIAKYIASGLLNVSQSIVANHQYVKVSAPINNSISINEIRQIQNFLKLKSTGTAKVRRIVIVEQAELMTIEAQNAFLKILEEPPEDTAILILTDQKIKLLPTIRSRAQIIRVRQVSQEEIYNLFKLQGFDDASIGAAYYASNAQIGLMSALLTEEGTSQHLEYLKQAKQLLSMTKLQRLSQIDSLIKQKEIIPNIVNALAILSQAALKSTSSKNELLQAKRWHHCLALSLEAEDKISKNANNKLMLTDLLLNL